MRILHMVLVNLSRSITQKHTQPPLVMSSVCEEAYVPLSTQMPLFTSTHHPSPTETEIDKSIHSLRCDHDPSQLSPHYPIRIAQSTPYNQATPSHPDPSMSTFSTACISSRAPTHSCGTTSTHKPRSSSRLSRRSFSLNRMLLEV